MGSQLKNRVNSRLCFTDEAKHRKRCYQCSGFSANIHHSCHKGQLGPFAQCDLVHTGQNRTMQYFCSHVCNTIQYRAISQSVPGSYRRNFFPEFLSLTTVQSDTNQFPHRRAKTLSQIIFWKTDASLIHLHLYTFLGGAEKMSGDLYFQFLTMNQCTALQCIECRRM